jgi:transmembrane exosortase EpsH
VSALPLLLFLSAIPLPLLLETRFILPLQRAVSGVALRVVDLTRGTADPMSHTLSIGGAQLDVTIVCGNLRALGPLLVVTLMIATAQRRRAAALVALLAAMTLLAMTGDGLRLVATALLDARSDRLAMRFHRWLAPPLMAAIAVILIARFARVGAASVWRA